MNTAHSPQVLLLIDKFDWAFHTIAQAIAFHLSDQFTFTILAASDAPEIDHSKYDILHVFGADQTYHHLFPKGKAKIIKGLYTHLWVKHGFNKHDLYALHLQDADLLTVPSLALQQELQDLPIPVKLFPEGVDTGTFIHGDHLKGSMIAGWAGNPNDAIKRFHLAKEACEGMCELRLATGELSLKQMIDFYHSIDIILCTSKVEGCPRPVLEGMACGRFPVSFPVGIVPEVITSPSHGIIVKDTTVNGMQNALRQCQLQLQSIRQSSVTAEHIRKHRQWKDQMHYIENIYTEVLNN